MIADITTGRPEAPLLDIIAGMEYLKITSSAEYLALVQQYSYLVDHLLSLVEDEMKDGFAPQQVVSRLPQLISLVNVIGYFRGQDGMFMDLHELKSQHTSELYKNEDLFEARLWKIIDYVTADEAAAKQYKALLQQYYLQQRGVTFAG